jgi:outer membrane protein assembly factor BamB
MPAHTGVANGRLFDGQGGVRWRFQTRSAVRSTPAVTATRVFVGSGDSTLYAIDRASGKPVWQFGAGGPVHSSPLSRAGSSSPPRSADGSSP